MNDNETAYKSAEQPRQIIDARRTQLTLDMMRQGADTAAGRVASAVAMTGVGGGPGEGWYAGFDGNLVCVVTVANLRKLDAASTGGDMALPVCAEFIRRARHPAR